jgi:hypothetical protein
MGTVVAGKWYVMAGLDTKTDKPIGAVYVFDPANNTWATRKPMPFPAHHIMTAALGRKVYVFGGFVRPAMSPPGSRRTTPACTTRHGRMAGSAADAHAARCRLGRGTQ